jgi:hypothetical protein
VDWLTQVLVARLDGDAWSWLEQAHAQARATATAGSFFRSFALVPRKLQRADVLFSPAERARMEQACAGYRPLSLRLDELARLWLLLSGSLDELVFSERLALLFRTADLKERELLLRSLPLFPRPERWLVHAVEGVRSNAQPVFEAIALDNPYPERHFSDLAWNQMVLKALHLGCPVDRILGLEARLNAELVRMLGDFGEERRAARRAIDAVSAGSLGALIYAQRGGLS